MQASHVLYVLLSFTQKLQEGLVGANNLYLPSADKINMAMF